MAQTTITEAFETPAGERLQTRTKQRAQLHKQRYTSPQFQEQEWHKVWCKSWLFAGLLSDLKEPGDYVVYSIGPESVLISRDAADEVRAFYNVCQHRGNRLLSNSSGSLAKISCPYHGWTYELNGRLKSVPDVERFCPAIDKDQHSLKPVRLEQWAGMLWVNLDPDAQALRGFDRAVLNEDEIRVQHFHDWLDQWLAA